MCVVVVVAVFSAVALAAIEMLLVFFGSSHSSRSVNLLFLHCLILFFYIYFSMRGSEKRPSTHVYRKFGVDSTDPCPNTNRTISPDFPFCIWCLFWWKQLSEWYLASLHPQRGYLFFNLWCDIKLFLPNLANCWCWFPLVLFGKLLPIFSIHFLCTIEFRVWIRRTRDKVNACRACLCVEQAKQ